MSNIQNTKGIEIKIELLDRLIKVFRSASQGDQNELDKWVKEARGEVLIKKLGCSEEVADTYIIAALDRI